MGIREWTKKALVTFWEKKYETQLKRKTITYEQWMAGQKETEVVSSGEAVPIVLFQMTPGVPAEGAVQQIKAFFQTHPEMLMVYADEDVQHPKTGTYAEPWYKPDWSPDTFLNGFYWGSLVAVRKDWLESVKGDFLNKKWSDGECFHTRDVKAVADLAVLAGGYEQGCKTIGHIPQILFHSFSKEKQQELKAWDALKLENRLHREKAALISVIIPSKDQPEVLKQGLQALFQTGGDSPYEVIVVDNGSREENRREVESFLKQAPVPCQYLYRPMEFNFSLMCNLGVEEAKGDLLLFLNDDVEAYEKGWLDKLAQKALLPYVGAVGMKLYYPGGKRIQHVGIMNLAAGPMHKLQFMTDDSRYSDCYDQDYSGKVRNVLALTGACLMVQREKFRQAGGMKQELAVAYNDVELCFSLWELGYYNVVRNDVSAYHHESLSRGADGTEEKYRRLVLEQERLYQLHPKCKGYDPFYPRALNQDLWDTAIRPAFVTAGNSIQKAAFQRVMIHKQQYRRDDCLLIGMEACDSQRIHGYAVVLGDNNACYRKSLVLCRAKEQGEEEAVSCLLTSLEEQYRPDLSANLEGQCNVELCGFWLELPKLEAGVYVLGILAESRVSGVRLINWSQRQLKIEP